MTTLNAKILDIARTQLLFERGPVRDPHVAAFRLQCERDERLREAMERDEDAAARAVGYESMERWFEAEQCPSNSNF